MDARHAHGVFEHAGDRGRADVLPDGRWIAYTSNEAGGAGDVYVRPFPGPGGKWRISTAGGRIPSGRPPRTSSCSSDPSTTKIMTAPYAVVGESFRADTPRSGRRRASGCDSREHQFDLHPDGTRVATSRGRSRAACVQDKVVFVFNFGDYLRTIAPGNK